MKQNKQLYHLRNIAVFFFETVRARQSKTEDVKQFFSMVKVLEVKI